MLIFYHYSKECFSRLTPQMGPRRHGGEGAAVGLPVVWLSDQPMLVTDGNGKVDPYEHHVDLATDDPDLKIDKGFDEFMTKGEQQTEMPRGCRWFHIARPVEVVAVRIWTTEKYI